MMKTPTKEQIIKIHRSNQHLMSLSHYTIGLIITEWEKIRNLDERVEEMCKNNPGIKDFEDFNKAINSPK